MSEAFYDPDKDKDALEKLDTSKKIALLGFSKVYTIIKWIIYLYTLISGFLIMTIAFAWVTIPLGIVAFVICGSIIAIYLSFYLPGSLVAMSMTLFDPEIETRPDESLTTTILRIVVNSSLSWVYVEKKLLGTTHSSIIFS